MTPRRSRAGRWLPAAAALLLAAPAAAQMDFEGDIPSLTGMREAEMLGTYAFARERPRMYGPLPLLHLPLTPWTEAEDEHPWSEVRADTALRYARWTFGRCGIVLDRGPLGHTARAELAAPNEKLLRGSGHGETLVYLVDEVEGRAVGAIEASKTRYPFAAAEVENGVPVLTVLPHLLGRRLSAGVSEAPNSLMLNERTLLTAYGASVTAAAGFFDPRRFGFSDAECDRMRESLLRETQCSPRAHVFQGRGYDRWGRATLAERRAARRADIPWPLGSTEPDDVVVAPSLAQDGLFVFARQDARWQGFFWRYGDPADGLTPNPAPGQVEVYQGFAEPGGLGLAVHPIGAELSLLTFAEGSAVEAHSTSWVRPWSRRRARPVRTESVPCRVFLTSGQVGQGEGTPLAVVCHDRIWRLWKQREREAFALPKPARWASLTRRCNDDAQLWLGAEDGELMLYRLPAFGPPEREPLPPWATWPAAREVPFAASWGGLPRSLDRVNVRRFDTQAAPRWTPAESEPRPSERGLWLRFEDLHGPGWAGYDAGRFRVE